MATIQEKIVGLYIAFFNRTGDYAGLNYWQEQALNLGEGQAISILAANFALHPKFKSLYDSLSNKEFVEAIYKNVLGKDGDKEGIDYWVSQLSNGMSRSDMVANFVSSSLDFNPNDSRFSNLSQEDIDTALSRQDFLKNKIIIALDYINTFKEQTNLNQNTDPYNPDSLNSDPAYRASIKVIENITDDKASVEVAKQALEFLKEKNEAIAIINAAEHFTPEDILKVSQQLDIDALHYTNYGLEKFELSNSLIVKALDSNEHWNKDIITYSFNKDIPNSYYDFNGERHSLIDNWQELNSKEKSAVNSVIENLNSFLGTKLQYVNDNGDIRFNKVDMTDSAGFAFYPDDNPDYGGDVFLNNKFSTNQDDYGLNPGEFGIQVISHELGHALGLKHPFEGEYTLPLYEDDRNHSIMSYTDEHNWVPVFTRYGNNIHEDTKLIYSQDYSLYDIAALQTIYGLNDNYNIEDNTYTQQYSDYKIQTIWDAGGIDTLDFSNTIGINTIDLRGGTINSVDEYSLNQLVKYYQDSVNGFDSSWVREIVEEFYNNGELYTGKDNFSIAYGTVIENLKTGRGSDIVTDNSVDNKIYTNGGNDSIYIGNGGFDYIDGGSGEDTVYIDLTKEKFNITQVSSNDYILTAENFGAELVGIENIHLSDSVLYNIQDLIS